MDSKISLRRRLRHARASITPSHRKRASIAVVKQLLASGLLNRFTRFGFYFPLHNELNLFPLLNYALWRHRLCFSPIVPAGKQKKMWFSQLTDKATPYWNRLGVLELAVTKRIRAQQLDLIFVPLLGFDENGFRLGMGGGYYDASLAFLRRRKHWKRPYLVGVAYECQKVERIPVAPWDIRLNAVVTEEKCYFFR